MKHHILLSGGGTAGSVTPLLALAEEIRRRRSDVEFLFVGTADGPEKNLVETAKMTFIPISAGKFRRYFSIKNLTDLGRVWRGYRQAQKIIRDWRPTVAISAGSFVSVPVMLAAHRQAIPTLVHQQDVRPGLANRLMAPAADCITVAFESSLRNFDRRKTHCIGNPVRSEILGGRAERARTFFHLAPGPVLLVLGGGTGAAVFNSLLTSAGSQLVEEWSVIQVTGTDRPPVLFQHPRYQQYRFLTTELPDALAVADVVLSRAGLGAISELAALAKPTIFIPIKNTHQEANAQVIERAQAGLVFHQDDPNLSEKIIATLRRLRLNPDDAAVLGRNLHTFYRPDALTQLADYTEKLISS